MARLAAIVEASTDAIISLSLDGRFTTWNKAAEKMFGYSTAEAIGRSVDLYLPPERKAEFAELFEKAKRGMPSGSFETTRLTKGGQLLIVEISYFPILDADGAVRGVSTIIRDLTERRRIEDERRRLDARFRRVAESRLVGISFSRLDGVITEANDSFLHLIGARRRDLEGGKIGWRTLIAPERSSRFDEMVAKLQEHKIVPPFEEIIALGGTRVAALVSFAMLEPAHDELVAVALDFSEQKQLQERFQSLLESAPDALVVVDRNGRIVLLNARAEHLLGYTRNELLGQPVEILVPEPLREIHERHREGYAQAPHVRPMGLGMELSARRKDGTELPVEISLSPIGSGHEMQVIAAMRDVTEQRKIQREIQRLNRELEERVRARTADLEAANRELEAFVYSVAHDLRAPLRAIDAFGGMLAEEAGLTDQAKRSLERIRRNASDMEHLIHGLLALSRFGHRPIDVQAVDQRALVQGALDELAPDMAGREITVELGELPACEADPMLLRQVWLNLLSNALKFTRPKPKAQIKIGHTRRKGIDVFFVRDNGIGFEAKYSDKMFGIFERLQAEDFPGMGIGLAIVKRIITRHGGRIWAEGEPDKGATFHFTLREKDERPTEPPNPAGGGRRG